LLWGLIVFMISLAPVAGCHFFGPMPVAGYIAMGLLPLLAFEFVRNTLVQFRGARPLVAAGVMGIGMLVLVGVLYGLYLPAARFLQISRQAADVLIEHGATHPGQAIMIDYKETSLPFYQGGTIRP